MRLTLILIVFLVGCGPATTPPGDGSGSGSGIPLRIPDDPVPTADAIAFAEDAVARTAKMSVPEQTTQIAAAEKALHGIMELKRGDQVVLSVVAVERALGMLVDGGVPLARRAAVASIVLGANDSKRTDDVGRYGPALRHLGQPHGR